MGPFSDPDGDDMTAMDVQHREIDAAEDTLRGHADFIRRLLNASSRMLQMHENTKQYLRGLHDGLTWGEREVDGITQYDSAAELYDVRAVPDDEMARLLEVVVSEAKNENWGNVQVNLRKAGSHAGELRSDEPAADAGANADTDDGGDA